MKIGSGKIFRNVTKGIFRIMWQRKYQILMNKFLTPAGLALFGKLFYVIPANAGIQVFQSSGSPGPSRGGQASPKMTKNERKCGFTSILSVGLTEYIKRVYNKNKLVLHTRFLPHAGRRKKWL